MSFYIPSFHINAHQQACIDKFHPQNDVTLGDIDGEAVERVWSQLASFSFTTRNMSSMNRKEQLEDAFKEIQRKVRERLAKNLFAKRKKNERQLRFLVKTKQSNFGLEQHSVNEQVDIIFDQPLLFVSA